VPQHLLAAQVLYAADQPRLFPLRRRRFRPFGAGPACSCTRFQSRSRISRFNVMKAEPTYFRVLGSAMSAKAG
jgi:hypothetical protein